MKRNILPLYLRVKGNILTHMSSRDMKVGDRLPSERELGASLGVSRVTVIAAMKELQEEGYLRKVPGSGTFVAKDMVHEDDYVLFPSIAAYARTEISYGLFHPSDAYLTQMRMFAGMFQLEHPDVKINLVPIRPNASQATDPYIAMIGSGEAPTVGEFYLHADYAAMNGLLPLEDRPDFRETLGQLDSRCVRTTTNADGDGHIHALPLKIATRALLVNTDLAKEAGIDPDFPPANWEDLAQWAQALGDYTRARGDGYYGLFAQRPHDWHSVIVHLPYLWEGGAPSRDNSIAGLLTLLDNPHTVRGLTFLQRLIKSGNCYLDINGVDMFASGRIGMLMGSSAWPVKLNRAMASSVEMMAIPIPSETGAPHPTVLGDFSLGIFRSAIKDEAQAEAAWEWIRFLLRKKQQMLITESEFTSPAARGLPSPLSGNARLAAFSELLETGIPQYDFPDIRKAYSLFGVELKRVLFEGASPAEGLRLSSKKIREYLIDHG
jgi:ABC-type glycerol-3-phosphate transport system substrate-binding protein/DNA-binding transcriptional regulator YhcF (GntR family)